VVRTIRPRHGAEIFRSDSEAFLTPADYIYAGEGLLGPADCWGRTMSILPALAFLILSLPGNEAPAPGGPKPTDPPRDVAGTQAVTPVSAADTTTPKRAKPLTATPTAVSLRHRFQPLGLTSGLLFHNQHDAQGATTMSQLRGQLQASGRLRVDSAGRFAVGAGVATGASFRSGWNHTAVGSFPADSSSTWQRGRRRASTCKPAASARPAATGPR
jgi:hypothetical protein